MSVFGWGGASFHTKSEETCRAEALKLKRVLDVVNVLFDSIEHHLLYPFTVIGEVLRFQSDMYYDWSGPGKLVMEGVDPATALWMYFHIVNKVEEPPGAVYTKHGLELEVWPFSTSYWQKVKDAAAEALSAGARDPPPEFVIIAALAGKASVTLYYDLTEYYDKYSTEIVAVHDLRSALRLLSSQNAVELRQGDIYIYGFPALKVLKLLGAGAEVDKFTYIVTKELMRLGVARPELLDSSIAERMVRYTKGRVILDAWWRRVPYRVKEAALKDSSDALDVAIMWSEAVDDDTIMALKQVALKRMKSWKYGVRFVYPERLMKLWFTRGDARVNNGYLYWQGFYGFPSFDEYGELSFLVSALGHIRPVRFYAEYFEDAVESALGAYNWRLLISYNDEEGLVVRY